MLQNLSPLKVKRGFLQIEMTKMKDFPCTKCQFEEVTNQLKMDIIWVKVEFNILKYSMYEILIAIIQKDTVAKYYLMIIFSRLHPKLRITNFL
jgi:hypothetical protein